MTLAAAADQPQLGAGGTATSWHHARLTLHRRPPKLRYRRPSDGLATELPTDYSGWGLTVRAKSRGDMGDWLERVRMIQHFSLQITTAPAPYPPWTRHTARISLGPSFSDSVCFLSLTLLLPRSQTRRIGAAWDGQVWPPLRDGTTGDRYGQSLTTPWKPCGDEPKITAPNHHTGQLTPNTRPSPSM